MSVRLITIALAVVLLSACGSGEDVPENQAIKPAEMPSGWTRTDLDIVSVATPPAWEKGETEKATETMDTTTWRQPESGGTSNSGLEVRVISKPQQPAEKAAQALAGSAMAQLEAGRVDPEPITWPDAKDAYYLGYKPTFGPTDDKTTYVARTFVLDLEGGQQVQVTAIAPDDSEDGAKLPEQVLSTVQLTPSGGTSGGGY